MHKFPPHIYSNSWYSLGEELTPPAPQQAKPKVKFSTYVMFAGVGLFLLGNLGIWAVRGKEKKSIEGFGKILAITGLLIRGAGEVFALREAQGKEVKI